jgi:hypothetical protein
MIELTRTSMQDKVLQLKNEMKDDAIRNRVTYAEELEKRLKLKGNEIYFSVGDYTYVKVYPEEQTAKLVFDHIIISNT